MAPRVRRGLATWLAESRTPIFLLDDRRIVLVFNRGCERLTGRPMADVIGKPCAARTGADPESVETLTAAMSPPESVYQGGTVSAPFVCPRRDGQPIEKWVHFIPLPDDGDGKTRVLGLIVDPPPPMPASAGSGSGDAARHFAELHRRHGVSRLVAVAPVMQRVAARIAIARTCEAAVHLVGERGTGKEHVARLIHYADPRRTRRFIPIRCATATHFEVHRTLQRLADEADRAAEPIGAILLDNVERLARDQQETVLRMCDLPGIRWFSTAAIDVTALPEASFSSGLASRLTSIVIELPPLRDRLEDVPLLARQLIEETNVPLQPQRDGLSPDVERAFLTYDWPGNVDELAAVIAKACGRRSSGPIVSEDLPWDFHAGRAARETRPAPVMVGLDAALEEYERQRIERALRLTRGNRAAAAELLRIPRPRLYRRMEALGFTPTDPDDDPSPADPVRPGSD